MHRRWLWWITVPTLAIGAVAMRGSAQTQPTERSQPTEANATTMPATAGDNGPDDRDGPFRGPRGGGMERRAPMDVMRGFLELVDRYTQLAGNPDAVGVSAVLATNDPYRGRPAEAIAYFTKLLDEVRRPTVKRAIRLQFIDLYKAAGKTDQAIEQLEILMKAPAGE